MPEISPQDEHNLELIRQTHPDDWQNPIPDGPYNLVVVGGGTAGLVAAAGAAGLGAQVALIEHNFLGGDCLNYGCVPSKSLIRSATAFAHVRDAEEFGVENTGSPSVNFSNVMERMRKHRAEISQNDSAQRFVNLGVDVYLGPGEFLSEREIRIGEQVLTFSKAVIATGARASAPPIPGLDSVPYLTNENVFNLETLPPRLAVIGAGPIGCEMAQSFQRFGSQVSLLERSKQILIKEDPDVAEVVQNAVIKDGVYLHLGIESILNVAQTGDTISMEIQSNGEPEILEVDALLVAVGRAPNVEGLGLEAAGVKFDSKTGVEVNDTLQTSNPRIYASGDVASQYKFTHAADFLSRNILANALFLGRKKTSDRVVPWATYTDPQIAHIGLNEQMASEQEVEIQTFKQPFEDVDRAILDGETEGFVKIHVKKGSDEIVGGTIVARHAGDMIGEIVMAMQHKIGLGSVANIIHPYPTQSEAIRKVGDLYNRTRLTPGVKKWMTRWLKWRRGK